MASLAALLAPLGRAIRSDDDDQRGRRSRAVEASRAMADTVATIVDEMAGHPAPMYAPDGGRTDPDRVARLAAVLRSRYGSQPVAVDGVAAAALFALLDAEHERRADGPRAYAEVERLVACDQARSDERHDAYASAIRFVREYAEATTDPGGPEHLRLLDLVLCLRNHYGVATEPAQPVPARVRYGGTLRCGTCGTPHPGSGFDGNRCPDCQPTFEIEDQVKP